MCGMNFRTLLKIKRIFFDRKYYKTDTSKEFCVHITKLHVEFRSNIEDFLTNEIPLNSLNTKYGFIVLFVFTEDVLHKMYK